MANMKPGNAVLAVAAVLFALTAIAALWNVDNRNGIRCGGWLFPNDVWAEQADAGQSVENADRVLRDAFLGGTARGETRSTEQVDACADARSSRTPVVILFGVATIAAFVVGVLRRYQPRDASTGSNPGNLKPIPRMRRDED